MLLRALLFLAAIAAVAIASLWLPRVNGRSLDDEEERPPTPTARIKREDAHHPAPLRLP